jgi:hypothetical protein
LDEDRFKEEDALEDDYDEVRVITYMVSVNMLDVTLKLHMKFYLG